MSSNMNNLGLLPQELGAMHEYNQHAVDFWNPALDMDFEERVVYQEYESMWEEEVAEFANHLKGNRVLSLGCGTARDADWFAAHGLDYVGVDISISMLELAARRKTDATLSRMNMRQLGFKSGSFDGVWCFDSFYQIPNRTAPAFLRGVREVLTDEGVFHLTYIRGYGEEYDNVTQLFTSKWHPKGINRLLIESGLRIFQTSEQQAGRLITVLAKAQ